MTAKKSKILGSGLSLFLTISLTALLVLTPLYTPAAMAFEAKGGEGGTGGDDGDGATPGNGIDGTGDATSPTSKGAEGNTSVGNTSANATPATDGDKVLTSGDTVKIEGGDGGDGGQGGASAGSGGGLGASIEGQITTAPPSGFEITGPFILTGGTGGDGGEGATGDGGDGADAGNATVKATVDGVDLIISGDATITGGTGGVGGNESNGGEAGTGGNASVEDVQSLAISGSLTLNGGEIGDDGDNSGKSGGTGGDAQVVIKGENGTSGDGVDGSLTVGTDLTLESKSGGAIVTVEGGDGDTTENGADGNVTAGSISVTSGDAAASITATGGAGGSSSGNAGNANITATGITGKNYAIEVTAGAQSAELSAVGGTLTDGDGGDASITVESGNVKVTGADADGANGGAASLSATGSDAGGAGTLHGTGEIDITTGSLTIIGGAGDDASNTGGDASVGANGRIHVGGALSVTSGMDDALGGTGGAATVTVSGRESLVLGDSGQNADLIVGGTLAVTGNGTAATGVTVTAGNGFASTGTGAGGIGTIHVGGLEVLASGPGATTVTAKGGSGGGDTGAGGNGTLTSDYGLSVIALGEGAAKVSAEAGAAGSNGNGGNATVTVISGDVIVTGADADGAAGGAASLSALGSDASGTGTLHGTGEIDITTGSLTITGGAGEDTSNAGGAAFVDAHGRIHVGGALSVASGVDDALGGAGGAATVTVTGRDSLVASEDGKNADLNVDGKLTVIGNSTTATGVTVTAGDGLAGSGTGAGGAGTIRANGLEVRGSGPGATSVIVSGGDAGGLSGAGGAGSVISTGNVLVTVDGNGTGAVDLTIVSTAAAGTSDSTGKDATLQAANLEISSFGTASAGVAITAGNAVGADKKAGDAKVSVGNMDIIGADGSAGLGGNATLTLTKGTGATLADDGSGIVEVAQNLNIIAGNAETTNNGGAAQLLNADDVKVGDTLTLTSGLGTAFGNGGQANFNVGSLMAKTINLTEADGTNSGIVDFQVGFLDMTNNDTAINFSVTSSSTASITAATIGKGHRFAVNGADDASELGLTDLFVSPGESGQLYVSRNSNLALTNITSNNDATLILELPQGFEDGDTFMTITGAADFSNGGQIGVAGDQSALARGDDVTLIAGPGGAFASLDQDTVVGFQGTRMYTYDLGITGLGLGAHVANVQADPRWKSLSEGFLSGQAFLNQGTDLLADSGMTNALRAAAGSESGPAFFGAISYGSSRYDTGSHIKVHGLSLLLGGAYGVSLDPGRLTIGAFFEYGTGSYDSHNDFANFASVKGDGDTDYVGGGLLTRFDFNNHGSGAFYAELSARAGRLSTDFNTLDIPGYRVSYDLSTPYFGLHAGLGHVFDLAGSTSLDLYAKYFWTHQEGKDFVAIDPISFGDVDSHRLRVGTRLSQGITDQVKFFAGAAYENEFSGKAEASSRGLRFDVPELKGSTGIGELGLTVLPNERVNLDVGVQGYVGTRKGVSGSVRLNFEF